MSIALASMGQESSLFSFRTGGPVHTLFETETFIGKNSANQLEYHFQLGFESQEAASSQTFADSVTVSLFGPSAGQVLTLATMDIFGFHPAPSNPGGIFLDSTAVLFEPALPLGAQEFPSSLTFDVRVTLPASLEGVPLTASIGFFDNQDVSASLARVALPVPEPSAAVLLVAGAALGTFLRMRRLR